MLSGEAAVLEALHALVDGQALSEQARVSAHGALIAIEGRLHEPEPEREGGGEERSSGHVMVSYQWDVQKTIERIVRSMQARGYDVWFEYAVHAFLIWSVANLKSTLVFSLDRMKGSTMDAMSEGVDGAEAVLYGVSLAYKESANCRLVSRCDAWSLQFIVPCS